MTTNYHTDTERLAYATSLFQVALISHAASPTATKRSLLFLYLFGWRYISRRQIYTLTGYHPSLEKKNAEEFIGKFIRADLLKRCTAETDISDDILYTPTKKGIALGKEFLTNEITRILSTKDVFYYRYTNELLLGDHDNLSPYIDAFSDYTTTRYKNKLRQALHRIATMDSYIAFLRNLTPATLLSYSPEVSIFRGEVCDDAHIHLAGEADVRSDAVLFLTTTRTGQMQAPAKDSHLVCIEQDTSKQTASVLSDKIARYINLVALPRCGCDLPTTLVFSVLPANRAVKGAVSATRRADTGYVEDILRFATLYCNHTGTTIERISLSDFLAGFPSFCGNSPLFSRHLAFLTERISDYGPHLPVASLLSRHKELAARDASYEDAKRKLAASFQKRKNTMVGVLDRMENMETVAGTGFSLCVTNNYSPVSLLSLFPELCHGRDVVYQIIREGTETPPVITFAPFYKHRFSDGTEITFRNAYHMGSTVYIMENIAEDYFGHLRLTMLLSRDADPSLIFLAVFPLDEYVHHTKWLHDTATGSQKERLFGCGYHEGKDGTIEYVAPVRIDRLPTI